MDMRHRRPSVTRTMTLVVTLAMAMLAAALEPAALAAPAAFAQLAEFTPPTNVRVGTITDNSIQILWDHASSATVAHFAADTNANSSNVATGRLFAGTSRRATFYGLSPGRTYDFKIRACYREGKYVFGCAGEPRVRAMTLPPPVPAVPTNLRMCTPTTIQALPCPDRFAGGVALRWEDNATDESRYELEWKSTYPEASPGSGAWITVRLAANARDYLFGGPVLIDDEGITLRSRHTYHFRVRSCNPAGCSGYSSTLSYMAP